ncbi:hypothetical protein GF420_12085 [candidate division GN15 bacterium]|nr:hypothetical protein [candidate division GN15 bacterium]
MPNQHDESSKKPADDRVEISEDGRARLAHEADQARREQLTMDGGSVEEASATAEESSLADGKLEQIRLKILSGFYQNRDVIDTIADRLSDDMGA